jgi:hypothetical protein
MRYWSYLIAKFLLALALFSGLWIGMLRWLPAPDTFNHRIPNRLGQDLNWTLALLGLFLLFCGAMYLIYWDQRYRCRTCLRRLRMPLSKGSWTNVLLGPPRTEYICLYGHGTLRVAELQITGLVGACWEENGDMWKELFGAEETRQL